MEHERIFGVPAWIAVVVLGAAGVVGYLIFFKNSSSSSSSGQGTTGYSQTALAVMQNPDESAAIAQQNVVLYDIKNSVAGVGSSVSALGGQVGQGFAGVHDQLAGNTYMNYYQAAYYASMQYAQAALTRGDQAGADAWTKHAQQYMQAIEDGRKQGYGVNMTPGVNAPNYYGQPAAAAA